MPQYDFLNLSPSEFENLTRDLLQKEFNVHIESFTEGRDGGIDLRFATLRYKNEIIQCKRYKDFSSLISNLKKEVEKVKDKNPNRYYIATSVGLTPNQKEIIINLFKGYIKTEADIYGKDELNNLLGKYDGIERNHYKLWLSSTNILNQILHSKIYNQSQFEIEEIKEQVRLYVQNDSFFESLKILNENHFVIISGIPGIGKTTLARILVYHLLSKGFEELAFLSDNIAEGYAVFQEEKKQVFLFDDFLGRNFLETSKEKNEEQNIVKFIEKINKSPNKALIFTTREYILKQAKIKYELFNKSIIDKSKYIVDLSKYTKIVRAQILYNHLYFSGLPSAYAEAILIDDFCLKLINHKNYNPRIIETFTQSKIWEDIAVNDFQKQLLLYFDYPNEVWGHAYENHITELSKCVLSVMFIAGAPILYDDLLIAVQSFAQKLSEKYKIRFSESEFKKSLKELENTFIITKKDDENVIAIEYQNASIQDFLVNHLGEQSNLIFDLIDTSIFFNQLSRVFTIREEFLIHGKVIKQKNKILLKGDLINHYLDKFMLDFDLLNSSVIQKSIYWKKEQTFSWRKFYFSDIEKISQITDKVIITEQNAIYGFVKDKFFEIISDDNTEISNDEIDYFITFLRIFKNEITIHPNKIIKFLAANLYWYPDLQNFKLLNEIYPNEFQEFESSNEFCQDILPKILQNEYNSADGSNLNDVLQILETLEFEFGLEASHEIQHIQEKIDQQQQERENTEEIDYYDDEDYHIRRHQDQNEDSEIMNMFSSLKHD